MNGAYMRSQFWSLLVIVPTLGMAVAVSPAASAGTATASLSARAAAAARAALKDVSVGHPPNERVPGHTRGVGGAPTQQESYNWSGYADDNSKANAYSVVSADWSEPAITCTSEDQLAAFFVGIDGFSSHTVEQDGTMAQCFEGRAFYYTWWEMYPANAIQVVGTTVAPGDKIIASVSRNGTKYTLKLTDSTHTKNSFSRIETCAAATCVDSSAEWIAEAPSGARGVYPLPDFKTWTPTFASVKSGSKTGTISAFPDDEITMVDGTVSYPLAQPGALGPQGNSFTVTWKNSY
jgi:Peptidase A4 family